MSKEILCPVCGEEVEPTVVEEKPLHRYKCVQENCTLASGLYYCEALDIEKSTLARIDRAVEEAVRKERERVLGWITENEITILSNDFKKGWNGAMDSIKNLIRQG